MNPMSQNTRLPFAIGLFIMAAVLLSFSNPIQAQDCTAVEVALSPQDTSVCEGSNLILSAMPTGFGGGLQYTWSSGGSMGPTLELFPALAGEYSVTVTDENGCMASDTVLVAVSPTPVGAINPIDGTVYNCNFQEDGLPLSADVTAGDSPSYIWDINGTILPGATGPSLQVSAAGEYGLVVENSTGCRSDRAGIEISEDLTPPSFTIAQLMGGTLTCDQPELPVEVASPQPGWIYLWNTGSTESGITADEMGIYAVTVTDTGNGCQSEQQVEVDEDVELPQISILPPTATTLTCTVEAVTLVGTSSTPDADVFWGQSMSPTLEVSQAGTYTLTVSDPSNGCAVMESIVITADQEAPEITMAESEEVCAGLPLSLSSEISGQGVSGVQYTWGSSGGQLSSINTPATTFQSGMPGNYEVSLTVRRNDNGCQAMAVLEVTVNENPEVVITAQEPEQSGVSSEDGILCEGGSTVLTMLGMQGHPPYTYAWGAGQNTAELLVSQAGAYPGTVTDAKGCRKTESYMVQVFDNPEITMSSTESSGLEPDNFIICQGAPITLTASPESGLQSLSYTWSGGLGTGSEKTVFPGETQAYSVTATDDRGCIDIANMQVTVHDLPDVGIVSMDQSGSTPNDEQVCLGDFAGLQATGAISYEWAPNGPQSSMFTPTIMEEGQNIYTVTGVDANGCENTSNVEIAGLPVPDITEVSVTGVLQVSNQGTFIPTINGSVSNYEWTFSGTAGPSPTESNEVVPNVIFGMPGILSVVLEVRNNDGCTDEFQETYTIIDPNTCNAGFAVQRNGNNQICEGNAFIISDQSTGAVGANGQITNWKWRFLRNGQLTAVQTNQGNGDMLSLSQGGGLSGVIFPSPGSWEIHLEIVTGNNCITTTSQSIDVAEQPKVDGVTFTPQNSGNQDFCEGEQGTLIVANNIGAGSSYDINYQFGAQVFTSPDNSGGVPFVTTFVPAESGVVTINRLENNQTGCFNEEVDIQASYTVNEPPEIFNLNLLCDTITNAAYQVLFEVEANAVGGYTVNDVAFGAGIGFTSSPIPNEEGYDFVVGNSNGCSVALSGPGGGLDCGCETMLGQMGQDTVVICETASLSVTPPGIGTVLDGNDAIMYVLHRGGGSVIVEPLDTVFVSSALEAPDFGSPEDLGMESGIVYYVSAVVGNDLNDSGIPSEGDVCRQVAPGRPVIAYGRPQITFLPPLSFCSGDTVQLEVSIAGAIGPFDVTWRRGGLLQDNALLGAGEQILFEGAVSDATVFSISGINDVGVDGGCATALMLSDTLAPNALPEPIMTRAMATCKGDTLNVGLEEVEEYVSVSWQIGGVVFSTDTSFLDPDFSQDINLSVVVEDTNGCIGQANVDVTALPVPVPQIVAQDNLDICQNESEYIFRVMNPSSGQPQYTWETSAGEISYAANEEVALNITQPAGSYFIAVEETLSVGCSGTDSLFFEVSSGVAPDVAAVERLPAGNILVCVDSLVTCYQWGYISINNGNAFTLLGQNAQAYVAGASYAPDERIYFVDIWNGDCEDASQACATRCYFNRPPVTTSEEIKFHKPQLVAYPNPSSGVFTLEVRQAKPGAYWLQVFNAVGQRLLVQEVDVSSDQSLLPVRLPAAPSGRVYLILENRDGQRFRASVILQK